MDKAYEIKKTYLAMLILIENADGKIDEWEERYIDTIADKLEINCTDKFEIKKNPVASVTQLPDTYEQRIEFFYNLLFMMGIDNDITEEEKELCRKVGFKLCFNPMLMEDLITIMSESLGKKVPADQVINAVIKYQN
ncbi:MAG: TerB family tellurite resistance protein [Bacteroidales bacterium]|nr:TerB family tellurite resistance protein [Bacteroidales bacterium]MBN2821286.1 TerB family tellurite resistance protein [Bacteroidales bacterium]